MHRGRGNDRGKEANAFNRGIYQEGYKDGVPKASEQMEWEEQTTKGGSLATPLSSDLAPHEDEDHGLYMRPTDSPLGLWGRRPELTHELITRGQGQCDQGAYIDDRNTYT